jgi:hypothetical protein
VLSRPTMKNVKALILYQDCKAVVTLVTKRGGTTRTKPLPARMLMGKDMFDQLRIFMKYLKAVEMDADCFSKPYDLVGYKKFAAAVLATVKMQTTSGH